MPSISDLVVESAASRASCGRVVRARDSESVAQGAGQRIRGRQHVAGEAGNRVGPGIGDLALGPLAQVLHVRDGA